MNRKKPALPRINHTAPSGRRLSEQTDRVTQLDLRSSRSQVVGGLGGVSCAVALAKQALSTHSYSVGPTRGSASYSGLVLKRQSVLCAAAAFAKELVTTAGEDDDGTGVEIVRVTGNIRQPGKPGVLFSSRGDQRLGSFLHPAL